MDHIRQLLSTRFHRLGRRWTEKFENLVELAKEKVGEVKSNPHPFAFQLVFYMGTIFLVIPYKMTVNDKGYARLNTPGFFRRLLSLVVLVDIIAHVLVIVSVALKNNFTMMAVGGNITIDGLIYLLLNFGVSLPVVYFVRIHCDGENIAGMYNAWKKFVQDYTEKFLQEQHPFQIYRYDVKLNILSAILPCLDLGVGFCAAFFIYLCLESPVLMASYIVHWEVSWMSAFLLQITAVAHDTVIFTTLFYGILFIATVMAETVLEVTFVLKTLRLKIFKERRLMGARHHHAIVEVKLAVVNEVLGWMTPLIVCHVLSAAVLLIALVVKFANVPEIPFVLFAPVCIPLIFGLLFGIWCITRMAEDIRSESLDFNLWLERQIFIHGHGKREGNVRWLRINCRMFRRRAVGIRMSFFYQVEAGLALDYMQSVVD